MKPSAGPQREYTIGHLARAAGVNVETIRYYQRVGLLDEPAKPRQGYRRYPVQALQQIRFIKRAQQLGFSLQEIAELIALGEGNCRDVKLRAEGKRDRIEAQIKDLQALRRTLNQLIQACATGKGRHPCPLVESLLKSTGTP